MSRTSHAEGLIEIIGGRWTIALSRNRGGGKRYQDLHEALDAMSHKVLTDTLHRAERNGLVTRRIDPGRVETATLYALTDLGKSLADPLGALHRWIKSYRYQVEAARRQWNRHSQ